MAQYTTGEIAKLCGVSVRTVQFYDTNDLLKPSALTEGGRRLYSEEDLRRLNFICMLKTLGFSLGSIKEILNHDSPQNILLTLLDEQEKQIQSEIKCRQAQLSSIELVRESLCNANAIPLNSIGDIQRIIASKKKLKKTHILMLVLGIIMDIIELTALIVWILMGIWLPFAIGVPIILALGVLSTRMYYKSTAYVCSECSTQFKPTIQKFLFSRHSPRTRKLTCPHCGHNGYCIEVAFN